MLEESIYLDGVSVRLETPLADAAEVRSSFEDIPRGNTCPGVNKLIIGKLAEEFGSRGFRILDAPCGEGDLLNAVQRFLPRAATHGADVIDHERFCHRYAKAD